MKYGEIVNKIKSSDSDVVLFGAGVLGKIALYALNQAGIKVKCFCDNDKSRQGKKYCGIGIISPKELLKLNSETIIFLSNSYIDSVRSQLKGTKFHNVFDCVSILENTDFSNFNLDLNIIEIERQIALYKSLCVKPDNTGNYIDMKYIDVVVTERCSMRCRDCSNLMQYYKAPQNCDIGLLFKSIDKLMGCIDRLHEFRVIGGEPFMNTELDNILSGLLKYGNADKIVILTNATIVPNNKMLETLKNKKIVMFVTNYGKKSKKYGELLERLKENGIQYVVNPVGKWTDSGKIKYQEKTEDELRQMFADCCVNNTMTLLNGKLFRCPFSAHATNLGAIPVFGGEIVDLNEGINNPNALKKNILELYNDKKYLRACFYCNGRDFTTAKIPPAIQAKEPLEYKKVAP